MILLQGDCLERMRELPEKSVDMIFVDLPYGITENDWDVRIDENQLWENWHRLMKPKTPVLLFSQNPFAADLILSNKKEFRYEWVYEKTNAGGFLNASKMPLRAHELILVVYQKLPTYNPQLVPGEAYRRTHALSSNYGWVKPYTSVNEGTRHPRDVVKYSNGVKRGCHPTQKPLELLKYMILTYTNPGDIVLDCCMGSGSTGIACVQTGREFWGIELDEVYFETAKEDIEAEIAKKEAESHE